MDFEFWWLLALPVFFGMGWVAARVDLKSLLSESRALPSSYFRGLNFLLNEQPDKAIESFLQVAKENPQTVELQFALGSLFRRRGEVDRPGEGRRGAKPPLGEGRGTAGGAHQAGNRADLRGRGARRRYRAVAGGRLGWSGQPARGGGYGNRSQNPLSHAGADRRVQAEPAALTLVTKASPPPPGVLCKVPAVVGKFVEEVWPVT